MTAGLVVEVGETDSVLSAARQAETIAIGAGGFVTDEDTQVERRSSGDPESPEGEDVSSVTVSSLTIRVPPPAVDDVLTSLAGLGTLISQNRATTDVTDEYVDVQARLDSQRASLDRLLQLVGQAGELDDVIALENEIARRQADLDSLAARLQALEEQTDLATISLTLTSADAGDEVVETKAGFLTGLDKGWDAFTGSVVAALTVVGALLPFLVLLALVAIPLLCPPASARRSARERARPARRTGSDHHRLSTDDNEAGRPPLQVPALHVTRPPRSVRWPVLEEIGRYSLRSLLAASATSRPPTTSAAMPSPAKSPASPPPVPGSVVVGTGVVGGSVVGGSVVGDVVVGVVVGSPPPDTSTRRIEVATSVSPSLYVAKPM